MLSSPNHNLSLLNSPSRKRIHAPGDDFHTPKRRRTSISFGLVLRTELAPISEVKSAQTDSRDRFLPTLTTTEPFYHLNKTSPPSARLARALGFIQPRLLSFHDDAPDPLLAHHLSDPTLPTRTHLSQSLTAEILTPGPTHSATKYGRAKPDRVLDSGPMDEFPLHPCAWSSKDAIAAVIRGRVFTHDMDTNAVSSLEEYGLAACVEWTSDNELAVGYDWGGVVLFDGGSRTMRKYLLPRFSPFEVSSVRPNAAKVKAMSWSKEHGVLAVGRMSGEVSYFDPRQDKPIRSDCGDAIHPVLGVKWSPDGAFLASGHKGGIVKCMDWKANSTFELKQPHGKTAHKAAIKSLAWAPWNPHILATGGGVSDHAVRIWSVSGSDTPSQGPSHTLPFTSGISSLHFSPHTTELLSTHSAPALQLSPPRSASHSHSRRRSTGTSIISANQSTATRHALLVHTYPSLQRVHTVLDAHAGPIVDSVLAPDGARVMTFGEDETLRVWTVWGERKQEKTFSMMDRYRIR